MRFTKTDIVQIIRKVKKACFFDTKRAGSLHDTTTYRKFGFTLAEVLITLGIIGVVAAMTMPTLVQKYKEKQTSTQLKKFYSVMNTAFMTAVSEYGTVDTWGLTGSWNDTDENQNIVLDKILPELKVLSRCQSSNDCSDKSYSSAYLDGTPKASLIPRVVLVDGTVINSVYISHCYCVINRGPGAHLSNICGQIDVDLNGNKPPNVLGKDIFSFYISKNGFFPKGTALDEAEKFNGRCLPGDVQLGQGCTAWVIYNENMDYLHCNDLSWNGKKQCK